MENLINSDESTADRLSARASYNGFALNFDSKIAKNSNIDRISICGSDSLFSLALLLTNTSSTEFTNKKNVLLVPNSKCAETLKKQIHYFDPQKNVHILPGFDMNPYSGLYPNPRGVAARVAWCFHAQNSDASDLFIASAEGMLQKTLPCDDLFDNTFALSIHNELPSSFFELLSNMGYLSTPLVEDIGQVSSRGGIIDVFSPAHRHPIRLELFGDTIDSIRFFDPVTQRTINKAEEIFIIPPREILIEKDKRQLVAIKFSKDLEKRNVSLDDRGRSFLNDISRGIYFHGIDYFLPYFYEKLEKPA